LLVGVTGGLAQLVRPENRQPSAMTRVARINATSDPAGKPVNCQHGRNHSQPFRHPSSAIPAHSLSDLRAPLLDLGARPKGPNRAAPLRDDYLLGGQLIGIGCRSEKAKVTAQLNEHQTAGRI